MKSSLLRKINTRIAIIFCWFLLVVILGIVGNLFPSTLNICGLSAFMLTVALAVCVITHHLKGTSQYGRRLFKAFFTNNDKLDDDQQKE